MFNGDTGEIVAQVPAPEAARGSGVARNEPEFDPGTMLGPNLRIDIGNP